MGRLPVRSDFTVARFIQTRWEDNDHYGHINNAVYYSYFDTAVNGWLIEATGTDVRELPEIGVVASTRCRFLRSMSFPDPIEVGVGVGRVGTSSITYRLAVFVVGDPAPRAVGEFVHVYVDSEGRHPVPIPNVIRAAVSTLPTIDID